MGDGSNWEAVQRKTFTRWANTYLVERMLKINDLEKDMVDGVLLCNLCEIISSKKIPYNPKPRIHQQNLENLTYAINFLQREGLKLVNIDASAINQGRVNLILGMLWTIILRYQINVNAGAVSPKQELLDWVRSKIPEYNINNFTKDWQSGKALCALAEAVLPGQMNLPSDFSNNPITDAKMGMDAAAENMAIPRILDPEDMVHDADELSNMTYISYFRDYLALKKKKDEQERLERIPVASKCKAYGRGLEPGNEAAMETEFTVEAINTFGRRVPCGGHSFPVTIKGPSGQVPSVTTDNGDGTYLVKYTPLVDGNHIIEVKYEGENISGSPFKVYINPARADPSKCRCYGPGLESGEAHKPAKFTIESYNKNGDRITSGGTPFSVSVTGPFGDPSDVDVVDNKDGTYSVTYMPTDMGDHKVEVKLNNQPVDKSPYLVPISANSDLASPDRSYAEGPGLQPGNKNTEPATFTIHAVGPDGKPKKKGGDLFDVQIEDPNNNIITPSIVDNKDGTYDVTYQPTIPGDYNVDVILRNPAKPLFYDHVKNSPVQVAIKPGTDAGQSIAYGPGLEPGVTNTEPAVFTIESRDCLGNPIKEGGEPFNVDIDGPKGKVPAKVTDNGDGTYNVVYNPTDVGDHVVNVSLGGVPIKDAPFHVNVSSAGWPQNTVIEDYEFLIRVRDKRNKEVHEGGEDVVVKVAGPNGDVPVSLTDNKNGTYTVKYNASHKGQYSVSVLLKGDHVVGSPVNHTVG
eukprot:TRINITY_DN8667_c0_g1_i1.p1 TRINITY_DN8667_c0_g1~~TRINITY_DN8667_c0_g1_i1.p1  ORF type:complete len:745 (-),score=216.17 TRINITY_DN8667_c0_g1_i1:63-2297(-)